MWPTFSQTQLITHYNRIGHNMILVKWNGCSCGRHETKTGTAVVDDATVNITMHVRDGIVTTSGMPSGDVTDMPAAEFIALTDICLG